jgi:hypothetical protein
MSGVRYTYSRLLQDRRSQVIELLERRACAIQAEAVLAIVRGLFDQFPDAVLFTETRHILRVTDEFTRRCVQAITDLLPMTDVQFISTDGEFTEVEAGVLQLIARRGVLLRITHSRAFPLFERRPFSMWLLEKRGEDNWPRTPYCGEVGPTVDTILKANQELWSLAQTRSLLFPDLSIREALEP